MAEIGLRTYLHQIDGLIEQKQLDEAIAHCKHILTHYPKSLETYRLLGKSLLEKARHGDAADIFQRVLSAMPDDFVAHVGMSLVREDEANLEAALWHMERAFESNPANPAIQEELRRLYGRRDGVMPARARLTRGALARLYVKGELYPQAEAELRAALAEDPERLDLLSLLARVLLEIGHRAEATELVNQILQKLPYSQEGNRLMVAILNAQNRPDDARACRQRLEALDPYEAFADGHGTEHVRDDLVRVPEMAQTIEQQAETRAAPEWAVSLGETEAFGQPLAAEPGEEPEWLKTGTGMLTAQPAALTGATDLPAAGEVPDWLKDVEPVASASAPELPDWMKATTGMLTEATSETGEPKKKKTGSLSEWLKPEESAGPLPEAEIPDWMKDIAPPAVAEEPTRRLDELPEWMRSAGEQEAAHAAPWLTGKLTLPGAETEATGFASAEAPADEALPEWLKPTAPPQAEGTTAPPAISGDDVTRALDDLGPAELPAWLRASAAEAARPVELTPAWLSEAAGAATAEGGVTGALDELPEWLRGSAAEPADALPEWLKSAAGSEATPAGPAEPTPAPQAAAAPAEELPEWLKAISGPAEAETAQPAEAAPAPPAVELPDFLQPASAAAIERANAPVDWEETPTGPEATPDQSAIPDWLKAMAPDLSAPATPTPEAELPPVVADELPDWLRPGAALAAGAAAGGLESEPGPAAEGPAPLPDWLKTMESEAPTSPSPSATQPSAEAIEADVPDWLRAAMEPEAATAEAPAAEAPIQATPAENLPDWLKAIAAEEAGPLEPAAPPAEAASSPAWLPTTSAPEAPAAPAEGLPDWARPPEAEAGFVTEPLTEKAVPDWLRKPGEAAAGPPLEWLRKPGEAEAVEPLAGEPALPEWLQPAASAAAAPVTPPEAEMPDLSTMDADEAMRWLETLAARQGAAAEELVTRPEERSETPPAWVAAETAEAAPQAAPTPEDELPDWLKAAMEPEAEAPAPAVEALPAEAPPAAAEAEAEMPDLSTMDADEAMRWLETLAARQGAAAEELVTRPEERSEAPPAWVAAETAEAARPEAAAPEAAIPTPAEDLPDWLKAVMEPEAEAPAPAVEALPAEAPPAAAEAEAEMPDLSTMDADEAMRWLETLAARQGAAAEELVTRPEERSEAPPAWVAAETPAPDLGGGPVMPPTGILPQAFLAEEAAPAPAGAEVPEWLQALQQEEAATAEPAAAEPTPAEALPDWLKAAMEPEAEAPAPAVEALPAEAPPAAAEAEAEMPDLSTMDADEAMRWLETLAARQGAAAEELVTRPEERSEAPPAWVAAETAQAAEPPAEPERVGPLMPPTGLLPEAFQPAAEKPPEPEPEAHTTDIPAWLAGYSTEPVSETPDWLKAIKPAEPPVVEEPAAPEEPAPEPVSGLPDWIRAVAGPEEAPAPPAAAAPTAPTSPPAKEEGADRLARLAERLAASRRAKELEVADRLERQRADREAAQREIAQKMEERRSRQSSGTGPLKPGTGPLKPGTGPLRPGTGPLKPETGALKPEAEAARPAPEQPAPRPAPARVPAKLTRTRRPRSKSPYAGREHAEVLSLSRQRLAAGEFDAAAESFGHLIHGGHLLPEIIAELEGATFNNPGAATLLRALGDAYMRDNQLQKALDAYRQALAQL